MKSIFFFFVVYNIKQRYHGKHNMITNLEPDLLVKSEACKVRYGITHSSVKLKINFFFLIVYNILQRLIGYQIDTVVLII